MTMQQTFAVEDRVRHFNGDLGTVTHVNRSGAPDVRWDGESVPVVAEPCLITVITKET